jgi:hypothetical protein
MPGTGKTSAILLSVLLGGFALGLYALFALRFEQGDVFPAYSSLRADPLGTKVLYQALELLPGISVERHYRDLSKLAASGAATLFYLGLKPDFLTQTPPEMVDKMEALAQRGARLVLAFQSGHSQPAGTRGRRRLKKDLANRPEERDGGYQDASIRRGDAKSSKGNRSAGARPADAAPRDTGNGTTAGEAPPPEPKPSAAEKWGVPPAYAKIPKGVKRGARQASLIVPAAELPPEIASHTALYFKNPGPAWRIVYSVAEQPVVIERPMGAGSLVLVADGYLFSNEAMRKERYPGLLAWLTGQNPVAVFDEFHLGVSERRGIMTLVRRFRLHGLLAALALLAGLFAWRNAVPFIPNRAAIPSTHPVEAVPGRDQLQGLIHLLQRNIEPGDLLPTCFDEWRKSLVRSGRGMPDKIRRSQQLIDTRRGKSIQPRDAVSLYRQIAAILAERN